MRRVISIESDIRNLTVVEHFLEQVSQEINMGKETYGKVLVSVMEAVNNSIIHGNKNDTGKEVTVNFKQIKSTLVVEVTDEGNGFTPEAVPDPTLPENIENIRGRGVFLITKLSDRVEYNKKGNSIKMTFYKFSS
jgi:serine/threonine-protein kinase RsbW